MPSGEIRKIFIECYATIGQVGNIDHENVSIGKAGRSRWLGQRPHVRGVAMNPVDHPLGGGEGKTSGGRHPVSPWGLPTKGYKTRNRKIDRQVHRSAETEVMGRSTQERSVRRHAAPREDRGDEPRGREEGHQDVVAPVDGDPRDGGAHARRAQREEVHPGVRDREHGRPQARRVRADAACSRATRRRWPSARPRRPPRRRRGRAARRRRRAAASRPARRARRRAAHDRSARDRTLRPHVGAEGRARARSDSRQGRQPRAGDAQVHAQVGGRGHREGAAVGDCQRAAEGRLQRRRRPAVRVGVLREPGAVAEARAAGADGPRVPRAEADGASDGARVGAAGEGRAPSAAARRRRRRSARGGQEAGRRRSEPKTAKE